MGNLRSSFIRVISATSISIKVSTASMRIISSKHNRPHIRLSVVMPIVLLAVEFGYALDVSMLKQRSVLLPLCGW